MLIRQFGTAERAFKLDGASWRDLEKARDCGIGMIAARLAPLVSLKATGAKGLPGGVMAAIAGGYMGDARLDDVRETLVQGLVGARQLTSTEAGALVKAIFDEDLAKGRGPMLIWCDLAFEILTIAIVGLPDETTQVGEQKAAKPRPSRRSRTAKPAS